MSFTTAEGMAKLVEEAKTNRIEPQAIALSRGMKIKAKTFKNVPVATDPTLPAGTMELRGPNQTRVRIEGIE
jgi:hypothetical protein